MYSNMENGFEEIFEIQKKKFIDSLEQENRYIRSRWPNWSYNPLGSA